MMQIDILAELEPYMDRFEHSKVVDGKLNSCSPFRHESHPSFVVWLDKGNWKDSGTGDSGSFVSLLTYLSGDDLESVISHLNDSYGVIKDVDEAKLELSLELDTTIDEKFFDGLQIGRAHV